MVPAALFAALPAQTSYLQRSDGFQLELSLATTTRAFVRVRQRMRPIAPAGSVFAAIRRELGFTPPAPERAREIITREGELAAVHHVVEANRSVAIGVVYGDDFYRLIVGFADHADAAAEVKRVVELVITDLPLGLAVRRRRWYSYTPPAGWEGCVRHRLIAEWFAPRFPSERAMLTVFPARPFVDSPAGAMDRHLHEMTWGGYTKESIDGPEVITISERLAGVRWRLVGAWLDGARTFTEVVVLNDGTFVYLVRLDHDDQNAPYHRAALDDLVKSIRPLPTPAAPARADALVYMVD